MCHYIIYSPISSNVNVDRSASILSQILSKNASVPCALINGSNVGLFFIRLVEVLFSVTTSSLVILVCAFLATGIEGISLLMLELSVTSVASCSYASAA